MKKIQKKKVRSAGFTLIEILVVVGIIAVLAAVVLVAVNPARQFKLARDSQRVSNVTAILSAVGQNLAEHKGVLVCGGDTVALPATSTRMKSGSAPGGFDLGPCIIPNYISALPFDPSLPGAFFTDDTSYDTGYMIHADSGGRVTLRAVGEINTPISVTR